MRALRMIGVVAALTAVSAGAASGAVLSGPVTNPANGHRYYLLSQNTWAASEAEAVGLGGHLVAVNDAAEQSFVFGGFGGFGGQQRLLWIGLNDAAVEGQYAWVSGDPLGYTNWAAGEPNNASAGEDFAAIFYPNHSAGGRWNDWGDRTSDPIGLPFNGVVEVVPEPATLAYAAMAALALVRRRRHRSR